MPETPSRNVEIKARLRDRERLRSVARSLAPSPPSVLRQVDTFFPVPSGRLKLRAFEDGSGELIQYDRPDATGPKESRYRIVPVQRAEELRLALVTALGVSVVVRKTREIFIAGQTRIHVDEVEGLGTFVELEVVLRPEQSVADGERIASDLMKRLGITDGDLEGGAYADLLAASAR
jgi:predicted adenylyl cyclase CyaB